MNPPEVFFGLPSQFVAAQQREMAMRNAREARFLVEETDV